MSTAGIFLVALAIAVGLVGIVVLLPGMLLVYGAILVWAVVEHTVASWVTLGIVTFASLGLIVASVTNTAQETQVINQLLWSAFLFLSGATLPLPMLPGWIQSFALFMPATYLVVGLERVLIAHVGAYAIRAELLSLAVCAGIAFAVSQQLFRWEPESKVPRSAKLWAASAIIPFVLLGIWETSYGHVRSTANTDFISTVQQASPGTRGRLRMTPQNAPLSTAPPDADSSDAPK